MNHTQGLNAAYAGQAQLSAYANGSDQSKEPCNIAQAIQVLAERAATLEQIDNSLTNLLDHLVGPRPTAEVSTPPAPPPMNTPVNQLKQLTQFVTTKTYHIMETIDYIARAIR